MALAIASNTIVAKFTKKAPAKKAPTKKAAKPVSRGVKRQGNVGPNRTPVSYTHLTLPTKA